MKTLRKILFIGVIIFALIFVSAYVFLLLQGKPMIIRQLENVTHKKVNIDYLGLTLLLNVEIRNLDIEGLAKVDYISASPSITGLLTGKIVLNDLKIIRPELIYEKRPVRRSWVPKKSAIFVPVVLVKTQPSGKQPIPLAFKHLVIKDGKINFRDYSVGGEGIKITVKNLNLDLTNLYLYPYSVNTDFTLNAKIPWQEGKEEGRIEAHGWLNLFKRNMQAALKITDIDGIYLYPYYSQWVDLEKTRIEKAKLNVTGDIKGTEGNLITQCHLELRDVVFKQPPAEEGQDKTQKIMAAVMDVFSALSRTNKVVFNFTVKGKMPSFY